MLDEGDRADDYVEIGLEGSWRWSRLDDLLLARLDRLLADQPALWQEP